MAHRVNRAVYDLFSTNEVKSETSGEKLRYVKICRVKATASRTPSAFFSFQDVLTVEYLATPFRIGWELSTCIKTHR